eukprot:6270146-Prymnesium_polylepis.2
MLLASAANVCVVPWLWPTTGTLVAPVVRLIALMTAGRSYRPISSNDQSQYDFEPIPSASLPVE